MSQSVDQPLSGVAETLLMTLYIRAMETARPDALIKDEIAIKVLNQLDYDFTRIRKIKMDEDDKVAVILRNREFDRHARDFLAHHPQGVIVHIGCGLDARFERVDNGQVEWYDLDLPQVIELRRKLIHTEWGRYHLLGCSVFDKAWINTVTMHTPRPFLFLVEGVLMYFTEAQVKDLVLTFRDNFPGAELVCDVFSPFIVRANNLRMSLSKIGVRYYWGVKDGKVLERWGDGITLVNEWRYFDTPEPRLAHIRWMRHIPLLANVMRIFHYRFGKVPGG
jgi:O-methyltransferase involved in polyketide biosynthesis